MGFLTKLLGRSDGETAEREPESVQCPHTTLTPSWDSVSDMGNEDRITGFRCEGCGAHFSAAEGRLLRHTEEERLQNVVLSGAE